TAFDVVLLDIWLPGMDGLDTLAKIRDLDNPPEVIMISGHGTIETAVRATKLGAYDFLEKPLRMEKTLILVKNAIDAKKLQRENVDLKKQLQAKSIIVGDSIPMKALRQQIALMAPTNGRVLIYGESGTGKELVAHAIHSHRQRQNHYRRRARDRIHQQRFGRRNFAGQLSRRPLLPLERDSLLRSAPARAQGRHPPFHSPLPQGTCRHLWPPSARDHRR